MVPWLQHMLLHSPATAPPAHDVVARDDATTTAAAALLCPLRCTGLLGGVLSFFTHAWSTGRAQERPIGRVGVNTFLRTGVAGVLLLLRAHISLLKVVPELVLKVVAPERPGSHVRWIQNEVRHNQNGIAIRLVMVAQIRHLVANLGDSCRTQHGLHRIGTSARRSHYTAWPQRGREGAAIVEREVSH